MLQLQDASAIAQIILVGVGLATIFVTLRAVRDQLWTQTYCVFTARYAEIMGKLSPDVSSPDGPGLQPLPPALLGEALATLRQYFNLCAEELYLHDRRKIDKALWSIWRGGIEQTMVAPGLREGWARLQPEYRYNPRFQQFMARIIDGQ